MLLGLASSVVVGLFLAYVGLLGETAQNLLREAWAPIEQFYRLNQQASDVALTALGVIVSAASASFAIVKTWHYAEIQLPSRVEEFIANRVERFEAMRPQLVNAMYANPRPQAFLESSERALRVKGMLRAVGLTDAYSSAQLLAHSSEAVSETLKIVEVRRLELLAEKAAIHLLRGLHYTALAQSLEPESRQRRDQNEAALREFKLGLAAKSNDIEMLELTASQCRELGQEPEALMYLENLKVVAEARRRPCAQARALRLIAAILSQRARTKEWDEARAKVESALRLLKCDRGTGQDFDPTVELAEAYLLLGEIQTKREKFSAAATALAMAADATLAVQTSYRADLETRLREAKNRYNVASIDPEATGN